MCVKVFLADGAEVMRKAVRTLLSNRDDIAVVGEASNFRETIQKTAQLHPDLIILELNLVDKKNDIEPAEVKSLLNGAKVLAIGFGADDRTDALLDSVGAAKLLDKMDLAEDLIPMILELGVSGPLFKLKPGWNVVRNLLTKLRPSSPSQS
jgi:DNA-binding NarL/FixJ family response regulator